MLKLLIGWMAARTGFGIRERGASLVEYALIIGLIAIVIIAVLTTLGTDIQGLFQDAADAMPE